MADQTEDHWFYKTWRPAVAYQYVAVCLFDFMVAPILNALWSTLTHAEFHQWVPLTVQGGGIYHLSMGAIVGVTSWSRGREKEAMQAALGDNPDCDKH